MINNEYLKNNIFFVLLKAKDNNKMIKFMQIKIKFEIK